MPGGISVTFAAVTADLPARHLLHLFSTQLLNLRNFPAMLIQILISKGISKHAARRTQSE